MDQQLFQGGLGIGLILLFATGLWKGVPWLFTRWEAQQQKLLDLVQLNWDKDRALLSEHLGSITADLKSVHDRLDEFSCQAKSANWQTRPEAPDTRHTMGH